MGWLPSRNSLHSPWQIGHLASSQVQGHEQPTTPSALFPSFGLPHALHVFAKADMKRWLLLEVSCCKQDDKESGGSEEGKRLVRRDADERRGARPGWGAAYRTRSASGTQFYKFYKPTTFINFINSPRHHHAMPTRGALHQAGSPCSQPCSSLLLAGPCVARARARAGSAQQARARARNVDVHAHAHVRRDSNCANMCCMCMWQRERWTNKRPSTRRCST